MAQFLYSKCSQGGAPCVNSMSCDLFEADPLGVIITSMDYVTDLNNIAADFMRDQYNVGAASGWVVPIMHNVLARQVNGGDVRTAQEGQQPARPTGVNAPSYSYILGGGGVPLYKELATLNKTTVRAFFVDSNNTVWGEGGLGDEDNPFAIRGFECEIFTILRPKSDNVEAAISFNLYFGNDYGEEMTKLSSAHVKQFPKGCIGISILQNSGVTDGTLKFVLSSSAQDVSLALSKLTTTPTKLPLLEDEDDITYPVTWSTTSLKWYYDTSTMEGQKKELFKGKKTVQATAFISVRPVLPYFFSQAGLKGWGGNEPNFLKIYYTTTLAIDPDKEGVILNPFNERIGEIFY